jgi:hypothetical protein
VPQSVLTKTVSQVTESGRFGATCRRKQPTQEMRAGSVPSGRRRDLLTFFAVYAFFAAVWRCILRSVSGGSLSPFMTTSLGLRGN